MVGDLLDPGARSEGFELKQVKRMLGRADFEVLAAFQSHRTVLKKNLALTRKLIVTIDNTRESYAGHSDLIVDSDLRKAYEACHPHLPEFAAAAIKVFAERELA